MIHKTGCYLCIAMFLFTQQPVRAQSEKARLTDLVEQLRQALQDPDQKKLDELISPQLTYGHSNGVLDTKESLISNYVSGKSNFDDLEFSEISVVLNENTAIVRHLLKAKSLDAGKEPSIANLKVMLVWTKEKGKWKLIGRQAVKIQ